ncbi:unnamed protein product, partial [marine sediment metagenome]
CRDIMDIDKPIESNFGGQIPDIVGDTDIIIQSCGPDQKSIEDSELHRGIFSYFFTEALSGAADKEDGGLISFDDIFDYLSEKVCSKAKIRDIADSFSLPG